MTNLSTSVPQVRSTAGTGTRQAADPDLIKSMAQASTGLSANTLVFQREGQVATLPRLTPDVAEAKRSGREAASRDKLSIPGGSITGMQKWTGRIVELADDYFTAELRPTDDGPRVLADFESHLLEPDAATAAVGDVVYVTVRTIEGRAGLPSRTATIRLRRMGQWSEDEVRAINARAKSLGEALADFIE